MHAYNSVRRRALGELWDLVAPSFGGGEDFREGYRVVIIIDVGEVQRSGIKSSKHG